MIDLRREYRKEKVGRTTYSELIQDSKDRKPISPSSNFEEAPLEEEAYLVDQTCSPFCFLLKSCAWITLESQEAIQLRISVVAKDGSKTLMKD